MRTCYLTLQGSLIDTLREATPSSHMGVPRVWEKIMEKMKEGISQCGYVKRKLVTWAMSVSLEANQRLAKYGWWNQTEFLLSIHNKMQDVF